MLVHSSGHPVGSVGVALSRALSLAAQQAEAACSLLNECFGAEQQLSWAVLQHMGRKQSWQNIAKGWGWSPLTGGFHLFHKGLPKLTLNCTAQRPQHKGDNKLLWQLGKSGQSFAGEKQALLSRCLLCFLSFGCGNTILSMGNASWCRKKGQFDFALTFTSVAKRIHTVCWTHGWLRKLQQYSRMPIGFLSFCSRLQVKWLL